MIDTGDVLSPAEAQQMRQQLAESAMIVDLLTELQDAHTQEKAIRLLVELAQELCAPTAVGFAPTASPGFDQIIAIPATEDTLAMVDAAVTALGQSRGWVQTGSGFALSVNAGTEQLGVLAVADVTSPERVEEYANLLAITSAPIGLVIANAQALQKLAASEHRYRLLAENASDVVWQLDPDGVLVWVSPSIEKILGWTPEQLVGTDPAEFVHPDDRQVLDSRRAEAYSGASVAPFELRLRTAGGNYRWLSAQSRSTTGADGTVEFVVVGLRDIHDEVHARAALEHAVVHDPLTGLATLPVAMAKIDLLLAEQRSKGGSGRAIGVLCVGADSLRVVNEAISHAAGDQVLVEIVARIRTVVRDPDLLARRPGDEFLVVLPGLVSEADASIVAERIRQAVKGPFSVDSQVFGIAVSIGIATGSWGARGDEIVGAAALAMHEAKENGRDCFEFFQTKLGQEAKNRISMEGKIRDGLRDGQMVPWFQPIVNLDDGAVVGYEALVRWVRPDGSVVPPGDFLPVAELTTLIVELDLIILRRSVEILSRLPVPMHVAVNVSATTLVHEDYARWVLRALTLYDVDPNRLHLEFTETALLTITERVSQTMSELAELGISWYVDDFGTGYSSIAHLRDLPIAGMKLDLSFTAAIRAGDDNAERVAEGLAGLARGLDIATVAEGVETPIEAAILAAQGWKHAQGWLYGRPAPAETILAVQHQ